MTMTTSGESEGGGTRRERARAATSAEIKAVARRLLVKHGVPGVSLRAVAREMGLSAPALYRYFPSHDDLVTALTVDLYDELADGLNAVVAGLAGEGPEARLLALGLAFRDWSVQHPAEFGLIFASPLPDFLRTSPQNLSPCDLAAGRFCAAFTDELVKVWSARPFPVPSLDELDPRLVEQLAARADQFGGLPVPASYVILTCWTRLYGLVCMEVTGHLGWALDSPEPYFVAQLADMGAALGLAFPGK